MFLGVLLLFDDGLLAIGNLMFLSGVVFLIGIQKTYNFFFQARKLRGTVCFLGGIFLVLIKWPIIGMIVESFGFINLFGDFFPVVVGFLRKLPGIGTLLSLPVIAPIIDKITGAKLPV